MPTALAIAEAVQRLTGGAGLLPRDAFARLYEMGQETNANEEERTAARAAMDLQTAQLEELDSESTTDL